MSELAFLLGLVLGASFAFCIRTSKDPSAKDKPPYNFDENHPENPRKEWRTE